MASLQLDSGQAKRWQGQHGQWGIYFRDWTEIHSFLPVEKITGNFLIQTMVLISLATKLNYFWRPKKAKTWLFFGKYGHVRENKAPEYVSVGESLCQIPVLSIDLTVKADLSIYCCNKCSYQSMEEGSGYSAQPMRLYFPRTVPTGAQTVA